MTQTLSSATQATKKTLELLKSGVASSSSKLVITADPENIAELLRQVVEPTAQIIPVVSETPSIGIDLIRGLKEQAAFRRKAAEQHHFLLINADTMTLPAQQASLKLLEEPTPGVHFWLITSQPQLLLPTIHSRCMRLTLPYMSVSTEAGDPFTTVTTLMSTGSYGIALKLAGTFSDKSSALRFVNDAIRRLHKLDPISHATAISALLHGVELLQAQVNVKLALEESFFRLIRATASNRAKSAD